MYNQFTTDAIKLTKERGGISEDVNIRNFAHKPEFWSWETA